jgi:membrane-associated PAP2 superfamily phosphatase
VNYAGHIAAAAAALILTLAVFECTSLDLVVQDQLYQADAGWMVDRHAALPRYAFYDMPKAALICWVVLLVVSLFVPRAFPTLSPFDRGRTLYLLACIALIPGSVSAIKRATNVYYPYRVQRYGGKYPYRKLYQSLRKRPGERGSNGFPAGHASGGFALLGLYFAARTRRGKQIGALIGLAAGWILGTYQMMKGAHYLSHTVVSMLMGWLIAAILAWMFRIRPARADNAEIRRLPNPAENRDQRGAQSGKATAEISPPPNGIAAETGHF